MLITTSKTKLLKLLSLTKSIFMIDNTLIGIKLIKDTPVMLIKKNEQCHGKFLVKQIAYIPYNNELPDTNYFFVINESAFKDAVLSSPSDNVDIEFKHQFITVAGIKCPVYTEKEKPTHHYPDISVPKTAKCLRTYSIKITPELQSVLQLGIKYVRAIDSYDYVRIYDGVMYFQKDEESGCTFVYSTESAQALMQVTSLEVPTCLLPNDVLKIIASIPTNNFGKVPELTITEHELMENHKHFNPYIIVCKYNGLSIIHSRKNNEYAPMHQIDYSIHDATFAFQTTVEDFYKLIGTKDKVITFKFPFPTFTGTLLKSNEQPLVEMHYDRELLIKALETFKTGTLCVMFKDTHAPLIMYNEKYVIYTKNMAYRRSED